MGHNRNLADYAHHFDGTNIDLGSGNIETEGVVTFEDVSNVDAVGIVTARAGVKVPDNQKVFLGTGDDLQVYHDGTDTWIDNDEGDLYIRNTGDDIIIRAADDVLIQTQASEGAVIARGDGQVELYHNNSKKLETTTTGATVTGTLVSDSVTSELDLSAISSSITRTATDIFVYDTRKDSDGGAWRKRTQHTSWYNENLNTSTRGSRREFPAVAVIVAEQNFIRIYDGDDPDLPMWMVFNTLADGVSQGMAGRPMVQVQNTDKIVYALNGILATGTKNESSNYGQPVINFISEKVLRMDSQGGEGGEWMGTIAQRNEAIGYRSVDYDYVIAASRVNDIAMTVLPNAPIDDTTGLPVPTIAVGTDGGASIIKDDGSVVDITITTGTNYDVEHIDFTDDNRVVILWNAGGGEITIDEIPSADTSANYPINLPGSYYNDHSPSSYSPNFLTEGPSISNRIPTAIQNFRAVGTTAALSVFEENKESEEDGMVAFISSSYNTGYQQGRIRGAFLSDTDTTNATYTTVADDWATAAAWTKQSSISLTSTGSGTSGTVSITGNGTGSNVYFFNAITVEANTDYIITVTFGAYNANEFYINDNPYTTANKLININALSGLTRGGQFNSGSNTTLYIQGYQVSTTATTITNVVVQKVSEKDRSVNNKGLQVFGTITKSAVATGADLVAYSGFGASNHLAQPYNSDLDPGSGSYSVVAWFKTESNNSGSGIITGLGNNDGDEVMLVYLNSSYGIYFDYGSGSEYVYLSNSNDRSMVRDGNWHQVVCQVTAGRVGEIYIDGVKKSTAQNVAAPGTWSQWDTNYRLYIGCGRGLGTSPFSGSISLVRYSLSKMSTEQIKKIYEDEKVLFQENAKATLYGSSDAVTALGYDEDTELLHVGTSAGRSDFQGLRRINNTTTAVTTAISASDELIAEQ